MLKQVQHDKTDRVSFRTCFGISRFSSVNTLIASALCIFFFLNPSFAIEKRPVEVKSRDKCPVCGMFVAKYPKWIAQVIFKDGTYAVFDGAKDMFKYYFNMSKYNPSKGVSDISAIYVTEYYSTNMMEAEKLFFVQGSDVHGPMGRELIPIATEKMAEEFLKDHHGKKILRFNEVTMEDLK